MVLLDYESMEVVGVSVEVGGVQEVDVMKEGPPRTGFLAHKHVSVDEVEEEGKIEDSFGDLLELLLIEGKIILNEVVDAVHDEDPLGPGLRPLSDGVQIPVLGIHHYLQILFEELVVFEELEVFGEVYVQIVQLLGLFQNVDD